MNQKRVLILATLVAWFVCYQTSSAQALRFEQLAVQLIDDVEVASLEAGVVQSLRIKAGDQVKKGDPLLLLDDDVFHAEVEAKKMSLLVAETESGNDVNLRYSRKTLAMNQKQLEKSLAAVAQFAKSISETEIDRLRLEGEQSSLSIEQAELQQKAAALTERLRAAELKSARVRLERRLLRSPLDGLVTNVDIQVGEAATLGQPVVRIINLDRLRVIAKLDKRYFFSVKRDQSAGFEVKIGGKRKELKGKVVFVSPEIQPTSQQFTVWVDLDNSSRELTPGLKGDLRLNIE